MNAILYARVSTDKQAQKELSIPAQLAAMRQHAKMQGWHVIAEYVEQGESARTMKRPELQKLIRFCQEKKGVDIVLVHKLDRLARNLPDYLTIKAELKRKGIRLVSMTENFEDSVTGRLLENIIASISEWYSGNLGEEIKKAALTKLQRGEWPHQPPLGYRSVRNADNKIEHVEDPPAAALVRQAFELFSTGEYSFGRLCQEMSERGLKTKYGKVLSQQSIKTLLSKTYYAGILTWNGKEYRGKHPAVIDRDLFFRVQGVLKERTIEREKGIHRFLLRGTARCASCGQKLAAENHPRGSYYRCPSHIYATKCAEPYSPVQELERQLEQLYQSLQPSREVMELLREEIAAIADARQNKTEKELLVLRRKTAAIESKELELADDLVSKNIRKELYDRLAGKYAAERKAAEIRVAQLKVDYKDPMDFFDKAAFTAAALYGLHERFQFSQRRILIRAVFQKIWIQDRKIVGVTLNPPFSLFLAEGDDGASVRLGKPPPMGSEPGPTSTSKNGSTPFAGPTAVHTRKDICEQLLNFTPSQEFLALIQLLEEFPDLHKGNWPA